MPITPAHEWHEGETWVSVDVKIRAVTASSANIMMTDCYAKVNCAPYFFEADLYGDIDGRKSSATVGQDSVKFFFVKKEQGLWGRLTMPGDRQKILNRRQRSLADIREQAHKDREDIPVKLSNIGRLAVGEQTKLEDAKRKAIELKKQQELRIEQERLKSWMASSTARQHPIPKADMQKFSDSKCPESENEDMVVTTTSENKTRADLHVVRECHQRERSSDSIEPIEYFEKPGDDFRFPPTAYLLPAPRRCSSLSVTFSSKPNRPVHLPARESRDRVELKKQQNANKDASNPVEREPLFLQDKADKFYRSGDYRSAINAYTSALEVNPSLLLSLANRAACWLQLEDYEDSERDCMKALYLLRDVTPLDVVAMAPRLDFQLSKGDEEGPLSSDLRVQFSNLSLATCLKAQEAAEDSGFWEARVKQQVLMIQGRAKYGQGKLPQSLNIFTEALRFDPTHKELENVIFLIGRQLEKGTASIGVT
ncbi:dynein axonemal assembly factor 4 [Marchantia polymorpha subsp. ruderalis]|uniref:CS domain-containing protein n=2 Tax=Marchantia polymorpha TaxID=3197 RepID=A0AAF6AM32_MARPO|nr:hypothetical protein MARPO_0043s0015 [Marchantia polymorpha]BBM97502.1 hypothetical protein Mp_1g06230 [Marchantia polymorpha subsp. ruderalis]|eukprot:PTQ39741.1 hypothetical protein MARPO_0043s0015 [Marchantia polymorpha]